MNYLYVALGLGLVIFFHELGHFAVAKWCDVNVERFSIGFGPIIWSFRKGETEYALSAIPFGGYVKMLGQDDMDPSQLSSEEIAEDPRSYSAKPVWQRMAIISAGVIMNIITGALFYAVGFGLGIQAAPAKVGAVTVAKPAWVAGLEPGDRITSINGRPTTEFIDIIHGVVLGSKKVELQGVHDDGRHFDITMKSVADASGKRRVIGAAQSQSLRVWTVVPGSPAAESKREFERDDRIVALDDTKVATHRQLIDYLAAHRDKPVVFQIVRKDGKSEKHISIEVQPQKMRTLGLSLDFGKVVAIRDKAPAAAANGLRVDDKITQVDGKDVGIGINPFRLPDYFESRIGQAVLVRVSRKDKNGEANPVDVTLYPEKGRPSWTDSLIEPGTSDKGAPLSIPSIGAAFRVVPTILNVAEGSPAAEKKVPAGGIIKKCELFVPKGVHLPDGLDEDVVLDIANGKSDWEAAFGLMQELPLHKVRLTVSHEGKEETFVLTPADQDDWFLPTERGLLLAQELVELKADSFGESMAMGTASVKRTAIRIYLTLRSLVVGDISPTNLAGPVTIAKAAYSFADQGLADLCVFLGLISINLAVINFLPIPVLDGGHMVFLCWEGVTRKKPSEKVLTIATIAGMIFVLFLMLFVIYLDLFVH
jgi:regulator of sigma E protease